MDKICYSDNFEVSGVYSILCIAKGADFGKFYIGSSLSISSRFKTHLSELSGNRHHNKNLQRIYNTYGGKFLVFSVIETCAPETVRELEMCLIQKLNPPLNLTGSFRPSLSIFSRVRNRLRSLFRTSKYKKEAIVINNKTYVGTRIQSEVFSLLKNQPYLTTRQIVSLLKEKGIDVTPQYINRLKSK